MNERMKTSDERKYIKQPGCKRNDIKCSKSRKLEDVSKSELSRKEELLKNLHEFRNPNADVKYNESEEIRARIQDEISREYEDEQSRVSDKEAIRKSLEDNVIFYCVPPDRVEPSKRGTYLQKNNVQMQRNSSQMQRNSSQMQRSSTQMQRSSTQMQRSSTQMQRNSLPMQRVPCVRRPKKGTAVYTPSLKSNNCCLYFRLAEYTMCFICLGLSIIIWNKNVPILVRFLLCAVSGSFVIITLIDVIGYTLKKPITCHYTWIMFATAGMLSFFACVGVALTESMTWVEILVMVFGILTALVFLFDLIWIISQIWTGKNEEDIQYEYCQIEDNQRTCMNPECVENIRERQNDMNSSRILHLPPGFTNAQICPRFLKLQRQMNSETVGIQCTSDLLVSSNEQEQNIRKKSIEVAERSTLHSSSSKIERPLTPRVRDSVTPLPKSKQPKSNISEVERVQMPTKKSRKLGEKGLNRQNSWSSRPEYGTPMPSWYNYNFDNNKQRPSLLDNLSNSKNPESDEILMTKDMNSKKNWKQHIMLNTCGTDCLEVTPMEDKSVQYPSMSSYIPEPEIEVSEKIRLSQTEPIYPFQRPCRCKSPEFSETAAIAEGHSSKEILKARPQKTQWDNDHLEQIEEKDTEDYKPCATRKSGEKNRSLTQTSSEFKMQCICSRTECKRTGKCTCIQKLYKEDTIPEEEYVTNVQAVTSAKPGSKRPSTTPENLQGPSKIQKKRPFKPESISVDQTPRHADSPVCQSCTQPVPHSSVAPVLVYKGPPDKNSKKGSFDSSSELETEDSFPPNRKPRKAPRSSSLLYNEMPPLTTPHSYDNATTVKYKSIACTPRERGGADDMRAASSRSEPSTRMPYKFKPIYSGIIYQDEGNQSQRSVPPLYLTSESLESENIKDESSMEMNLPGSTERSELEDIN